MEIKYLNEFYEKKQDKLDFVFDKDIPKREPLLKEYSYAVPNELAIETIIKYSPIVEIGAGKGYWASLIKKAGGDILAYDINPDASNKWIGGYYDYPWFFKVERGNHLKIKQHPDRSLFLCWPPYDESLAYGCLTTFEGKNLIYIGEGCGGCTADNKFFELLEKDFEEISCIHIPQFWGIRDYLWIYERK